ncbi:MAG: MATE family efflux transporter [Enterocloster sp.]
MKTDSAGAQYEKMTGTPVHKLVVTLGIPTSISMLVTNIYNMADTFFVSSLGTSASGATGIVFALMAIIQAFGFMLGHGAGSNISRQLGSRNVESARKFASTSFFLSIFCGSVILVLGFLFQDPLMRLLGSTDSILPYARDYSTFILLAAPAMASSCVMNNILRYEGKAAFAMVGLASGGILNIFGDMLFIFGMGMGVKGAGLSTAISQYVGAAILFSPFARRKVQSRLAFKYVTRSWKDVRNIIAVGFPSMMRQGLNSISVMFLNQCASVYGDAAIAAMSIVSRVINFLFCIGLGLGQGFQPVSAFNYGARKYSRVKEAFRFTCSFSIAIMCAAAFLGAFFAGPIITLFRDDPEVISIGTRALRLQCISLLFLPVSLGGNMLFQSIGKSGRATFLASIRSGLVFIPVLLILSRLAGLLGIEMSQMVADIISAAVTIPMVISFFGSLPEDGEEAK